MTGALTCLILQAENDLNEALSGLSSAERQEALQLAVMQRAQHGAPHVPQRTYGASAQPVEPAP